MSQIDDTEQRSIRTDTTLEAPIELVWDVWTKPEHSEHWWGPTGFRSTVHTMDVRPGGEWHLTLHGPNGVNYPNRSIFLEVVPHRKIVFEHFNPDFITTVLFETKGAVTHIDWTGVFPTVALRDAVVQAHKADEGLRQNIERLENYLAVLQGSKVPRSTV